MLYNLVVNINKKLILFNCCIFSYDNNEIVYFLKFFIVFHYVMNFYFRNKNNENVFSIKIIMFDIEIKFFINEYVVNNNINYKIRYVTNVQKIYRFFLFNVLQ